MMFVIMLPGATAFMRIGSLISSIAMHFVMWMMAAFAEE
jgi:hypothetical protein